MNRSYTTLVCLLATTAGLNACAPGSAELDAVSEDLAHALAIGDHDLARQLGSDFMGGEPCNGELEEPIDPDTSGYVAGLYFPRDPSDDESVIAVGGRLIDADLTTRNQLHGVWIAPDAVRLNGEVYARTTASDTGIEGNIDGDFRASPAGDSGIVRGSWTIPGYTDSVYLTGHWVEDATSEGRFFGSYQSLPTPEWGVGVRVRVQVDGVSNIVVSPTALVLHHVSGAAPGQAGVSASVDPRPTLVNGESWTPSWPEEGENLDCDCYTAPFNAPEGVMAPDTVSTVELRQLRTRGKAHVQMQPDADNGYTTVVTIDDTAYDGPGWYEIELVY